MVIGFSDDVRMNKGNVKEISLYGGDDNKKQVILDMAYIKR
jgi:hypothetical protein